MSIAIRSAVTVVAVALSLVATSATPANSASSALLREPGQHRGHGCASLTVTISRVADIPSGLSVRALQEGRLYPPRCR